MNSKTRIRARLCKNLDQVTNSSLNQTVVLSIFGWSTESLQAHPENTKGYFDIVSAPTCGTGITSGCHCDSQVNNHMRYIHDTPKVDITTTTLMQKISNCEQYVQRDGLRRWHLVTHLCKQFETMASMYVWLTEYFAPSQIWLSLFLSTPRPGRLPIAIHKTQEIQHCLLQ